MFGRTQKLSLQLICVLLVCFVCAPTRSEEVDFEDNLDAAEERARQNYLNRFTEFTKDKNVMGKVKSPDGQVLLVGNKVRFNDDDGLPFQSDLTYHDNSYDDVIEVEEPKKNGNPGETERKTKTLFAHVSEHGRLTQAGGSSALERKASEQNDKFEKIEEEKAKNGVKEEQKGVEYHNMFKETIRDLKKKEFGNQRAQGNTPQENIKVNRWEIREEAIPEFEKVGEDAFETVNQSAKDPDKQQDPQAAANLLMLYEAGQRNLKALYDSTLSNYGQTVAFQGTNDIAKSDFDTARLKLGVRDCQTWGNFSKQSIQQEMAKRIAEDPGNADNIQKQFEPIIQDIDQRVQQCNQLTAQPTNVINPRFEPNQDDPKQAPQLKAKGPDEEEGRQRDMRVFIDTLAKAGKTAKDVPSNWDYEDSDSRAKVTLSYDNNAQPAQEQELTVAEQIDFYNKDLQSAAQKYQEVQALLPEFQFDTQAPLQYVVPTGSDDAPPVFDVTKVPDAVAQDEFGAPKQAEQAAQSYNELLQLTQ